MALSGASCASYAGIVEHTQGDITVEHSENDGNHFTPLLAYNFPAIYALGRGNDGCGESRASTFWWSGWEMEMMRFILIGVCVIAIVLILVNDYAKMRGR